ncbi:MAG: 6-bladed beta-propeller [Candidatus Sulfotelmatobacter sp.]
MQNTSSHFSFVRAFSSAGDVRGSHPVLDRTLDIVAGPADTSVRTDVLQSPSAVTTDSARRVFVADPDARNVHIFDFRHSKYSLLDKGGDRLNTPVALATDNRDNLFVIDQNSRSILVYDSSGKFRGHMGKLGREESYFDTPVAIAIDATTRRIYVCDSRRQMILILDSRGRLVAKVGKRGGGYRPGEFKQPSQLVVRGDELFVLDSGNNRIQILDTAGHFLRAVKLVYADRHTGLAVDGQGTIYVSDPSLNRIQVFPREGQAPYSFDPGALKGADVTRAAGMWIDSGHCLYLVDSQSNRILLLQIRLPQIRLPQIENENIWQCQ